MNSEDQHYSQQHEWVRFSGDTSVGITEYARKALDSPVSSEVIDINGALATVPEKLNESLHDEAWLGKVRLSIPDDIQVLLSEADDKKYVTEKETGR
jgi:glycine cleavage system H protein